MREYFQMEIRNDDVFSPLARSVCSRGSYKRKSVKFTAKLFLNTRERFTELANKSEVIAAL